jgi:hypothetical protein
MTRLRFPGALGAALLASLLAACSAADVSPPPAGGTPPPAGQEVAVGIQPTSATVAAGGEVPFAAAVTGTAVTGVSWSVSEASCGSVDATGRYTAPGAAATCHVVVTSAADPAKAATAVVTVTAPPPPPPPPTVSLTVSPSPASVSACRTVTFRATVTGTTDTAVTWSVQEGSAGGAVSSSGVYTAPNTAGVYHVVATSHADPARTVATAVTVADEVLSVAVSPTTVSVPQGGSAQFTATVTTTCGAFATTSTVYANGTVVPN